MKGISDIPHHQPPVPSSLADREETKGQPRRDAHPAAIPEDRVEISEAAASYRPDPVSVGISQQRIDEIRALIAEGRYLTPDKIDVVVDRLHEELFGS